jgi:N-acetylmuramoyl-L-alanine amidase
VNAAVSVNLRKEPNTSCAVIGYIKGGTVLEYTDKSNGWYKVIYNGKTGWISGTYAKLV